MQNSPYVSWVLGPAKRMVKKALRYSGYGGTIKTQEAQFLQDLFDNLMHNLAYRERVNHVLALKDTDTRLSGILGERGLPGDRAYRESRYWKVMLTRYALGMHYSTGKTVLDSCSGIGWGSYLVDSVAKSVVAVDIECRAIETARSLWRTEVTHWVQGSVLRLGLGSNSFDVALAMESIEHFRRDDIEVYLDALCRVLRPGGKLIGSSAFPETREQADELCATNPYHLHICTRSEFADLLAKRFSSYHIYENHLFFEAEM